MNGRHLQLLSVKARSRGSILARLYLVLCSSSFPLYFHSALLTHRHYHTTIVSLNQPPLSSCHVQSGQYEHDCASSPSVLSMETNIPTTLLKDTATASSEWFAVEIPDPPHEEGFVILNALRHESPQSFGLGYDPRPPPRPENWKKMSQLGHCLSQPPRKGQTHSNLATSMAITSSIRTNPHQGAQIVVVSHAMVAKIYDPLFYPLMNDYGTKNDVGRDADADYCREVTAFERLQQATEAKPVTPAYYGSLTMMIETPVERPGYDITKLSRPVRFILMELLCGIRMAQIYASALSEEVRSLILEKSIIAEILLWHAGADHRDSSPRNVMVHRFELRQSWCTDQRHTG